MSLPRIETPHRLTCHCGGVELAVTLSDGLATARRCDCSFCRRRGAVAVSAPLDGVKIVRGEDLLAQYSFGTHTAKHYFCRVCGIYTHHRRRSNPNEYGVNAGALEGVNPRDLDPVPWADGVNHPSDRTPETAVTSQADGRFRMLVAAFFIALGLAALIAIPAAP